MVLSPFRYVALNMLMKAVTADAQAVQRHRATILECVKVWVAWPVPFLLNDKAVNCLMWSWKVLFYSLRTWWLEFLLQDADASIRRRALELVYVLVNESNVKPLTKELVDYLEVSDQDFKPDLTAKICSIVSKWVVWFWMDTWTLFSVYCKWLNALKSFH